MTTIIQNQELRNRTGVFEDRFDAGRKLGRILEPFYKNAENTILLSIPRGGVPVAVKMCEILNCIMDLVIVRKIQIPGNTEAGFGAMSQEGDLFLNEPLMDRLNLNEDQVKRQSDKVVRELKERDQSLRGGRPFPELEGKTVILVDDGLASGFTMKVSIYMAVKRKAGKIVVAVPTAPLRTIDSLAGSVDEIYCPNIREGLSFAVAAAYRNWRDLSESETQALLAEAPINFNAALSV